MSHSYIPLRDTQLQTWANNFQSRIALDPNHYGLTPGDAATITASYTAFNTALTLAKNPVTRTAPNVADKDAKKASMLATLRPYAQAVRNNIAVSNDDKLALGLTVPDRTPTPVPAPTTQPLLSIVGATPLQHTIRYADASAPDKRAKPAGATSLLLFVYIGTTPPTSPSQASLIGVATRQPYVVSFDASNAGKTAWYFGRWSTTRGLLGPWSGSVSMTIAQ